METKSWKVIEQVFNQAVNLPPIERKTYVEENCAGDDALCFEILSLLEEADISDDFLSPPVFALGAQLLDSDLDKLLETPKFASYTLQKLLGRGGMSIVFLAEDIKLERPVALKILPSVFEEEQESVLRFYQEARAASLISHPNLAHIYEFGEFNGRYYMAMEYVAGKSVRELLKEKKIDLKQALNITEQIAAALSVMHRAGVIHRDIKPENLIITDDGLVKVLDFGLAKIIPLKFKGKNRFAFSLSTTPGLIIGTTAYMSPEQIRGHQLDARADLWSLGVVLYEMISNTRPFQGETVSDVQAAILLKDPLPLPHETAPELAAIVYKLLNKSPSERYSNAAELLQDLTRVRRIVGERRTRRFWLFDGWMRKFISTK